MKKVFYLIIALLLLPVAVHAQNGINTSFDDNDCVLTVSGTQTGHDATVSIFNENDELIGFKTDEINNNNYSVEFVLSYESAKKINVTVSNENGENEITKSNVDIAACVRQQQNNNNNNNNDNDNNNGPVKDHSYSISDADGNSISFKEENGHTFTLSIADYMTMSEAELSLRGISKEDYEQGLAMIKDLTKQYGTLVAFLEIEVKDENNISIAEGPFKIRIKMTDEMKKYNTFKLIYISDTFTAGNPITLTVNGDYLEGTLEHLSNYALVGTNVDKRASNTHTYDNLLFYLTILGVGIIGLSGVGLSKILNNKKD